MTYFHRCETLPHFVAALKRGERKWLCALGDSNTANTNFTNGGKQWAEHVHSALKDKAGTQTLMLANAGVSGDSVTEALARFDHDVARVRPDVTILCLGSNDANRLDDATFTTGLNALIDRLLDLHCTVILRTPTPVWEKSPSRIWPGADKLQAKCAIIRHLAATREIPFIDTYTQWTDAEKRGELIMADLMTDEVHTNAAGHQLVARQVLAAFGVLP